MEEPLFALNKGVSVLSDVTETTPGVVREGSLTKVTICLLRVNRLLNSMIITK